MASTPSVFSVTLILLTLFLGTGCGNSETTGGASSSGVSVSGNIAGDDRTVSALADNFTITLAGVQTSTDSSGHFRLQGVAVGRHTLTIDSGNSSATMPVVVPSTGHLVLMNIRLIGNQAFHDHDANRDGYHDDDKDHDGFHDDDEDHDGYHDEKCEFEDHDYYDEFYDDKTWCPRNDPDQLTSRCQNNIEPI